MKTWVGLVLFTAVGLGLAVWGFATVHDYDWEAHLTESDARGPFPASAPVLYTEFNEVITNPGGIVLVSGDDDPDPAKTCRVTGVGDETDGLRDLDQVRPSRLLRDPDQDDRQVRRFDEDWVAIGEVGNLDTPIPIATTLECDRAFYVVSYPGKPLRNAVARVSRSTGVLIVVLGGIGMLVARRVQQRRSAGELPIDPWLEGERFAANYRVSRTVIMHGWLTLGASIVEWRGTSPDSLLIVPGMSSTALEIPYSRIEAVDVASINLRDLSSGGIRRRLRILTVDGQEHLFVVNGVRRRQQQITSRMRQLR